MTAMVGADTGRKSPHMAELARIEELWDIG